MPARAFTTLAILALAVAAVSVATLSGPARRRYVTPPRVVSVPSASGLYELWEGLGVRGRVAVVLARDLVPAEAVVETEGVAAIGRAMHRGIVREARHVLPDERWTEARFNLSQVSIYWPSEVGFLGAFEDGRVHVLPLSRLRRMNERALVVLDPTVWSDDELQRIARRMGAGAIATDLVAVVNGSARDLELLRSALQPTPR
jgi:hypothetical protein